MDFQFFIFVKDLSLKKDVFFLFFFCLVSVNNKIELFFKRSFLDILENTLGDFLKN